MCPLHGLSHPGRHLAVIAEPACPGFDSNILNNQPYIAARRLEDGQFMEARGWWSLLLQHDSCPTPSAAVDDAVCASRTEHVYTTPLSASKGA